MPGVLTRPNPEELLRRVEAEEKYRKHGRLKIFLGYASGVGKSARMLEEGWRRRYRNGEDVVVGAIQPQLPPKVQEILGRLEVIPHRTVDGVPVIDIAAILNRRPQVCLIDGLAYDNPPGSRHAKRWQDVVDLTAAGVSVVGTVNLQYIDELRDEVERITGKEVRDTIPLSFVKTADEIEVVDTPPETCMELGTATATGSAGTAHRLSELREMALVLAAEVVEYQLELYLERHGLGQVSGATERILVCVAPRTKAENMIESGRRNADRFHGDLHVAYVSEPEISEEEQKTLDSHFALARKLDAQVHTLESEDPIHAIMEFARQHGITQIFIGHSSHESFWHRLWGSFVDRIIREAEGMDVRVFPN